MLAQSLVCIDRMIIEYRVISNVCRKFGCKDRQGTDDPKSDLSHRLLDLTQHSTKTFRDLTRTKMLEKVVVAMLVRASEELIVLEIVSIIPQHSEYCTYIVQMRLVPLRFLRTVISCKSCFLSASESVA